MCGLAGILNIQGVKQGENVLRKMIAQLQHRGPDGQGYYFDEKVGLGHARLSIIDLEGGAQPIHNENESIWIVFNGEIFNYVELREQLISSGHEFYTHTDTEVIVHLYEQYGEDFVHHLNGQFAIAIWDKQKEKLILVRDRVGIVPLFYTKQDQTLIFASEVKAILPALPTAPSLNSHALDQLMTFWAPVSPETIFQGINEVSPGQMLVWEHGDLRKYAYWDFNYPNGEYRSGSEKELAQGLHDLLVDATRIRLRSDVPVGAYLSGGLDSSVIVAIIKHYSDAPLRTFSIGFAEKDYDEGDYQRLLIEHIGTEHSRTHCNNQDIGNQFLHTIWHTESPILRTAPVPMQRLSELVHDMGYKVVLTGEGSDEVLGGYDIFKEAKIRRFWARNPDSTFRANLLKKLYPYLDISKGAQSYVRKFFGIGLDQADSAFFAHLPRWDTTAKVKEFFSAGLKDQLNRDAVEVLRKTLPEHVNAWHPFNKGQYVESKSLMGGYLLCSQGDRMLLSNSVEGRFPFLDHRVIEFASSIHPNYKMKVLNEKYLLKKAFQKYLPAQIVDRYKQPYRAPDIPAFFGESVPDYVIELMSSDRLDSYGYFDSAKVARLIKKIERGRAIGYKDNMALVGILSTQAWHYHFVENFHSNFK